MAGRETPADSENLPAEQAADVDLRRFVVFQLVVWTLLSTVVLLPAFRPGMAVPALVTVKWMLGWTTLGIICSSGLAAVFVRLPERLLRGLTLVLIVLGTCMAASALWVLGNWALQPLLGREPWAPAGVSLDEILIFGFIRGTALCSTWSALFLVNLLSSRMQRERERRVRATGLAHQARLLFLQSQLNPHFLFNALNSVVALIDESPSSARRMVRDVAALLRRTLVADGNRQTTVEEELDFVRLFVKCEEVRFESRLQVTYQVEDEVLGQPVPSMLLHPLVENAIKHGMQTATSGPLRIRVSVRREGAALLLEVTNTGTLARPAGALLPAGPGIGLRNVQERLRVLFPERHHFELAEKDGWVTARIQLSLPGS